MKTEHVFLTLIVVQALHSLEEYVFKLFETFPPARFVSGLVSADLERGFVAINLLVVVLGIWCYWWPVRRGWASAAPIAWIWVAVELVNGLGHPTWSVMQRGYTPGLVTSLILLPLAVVLAGQLRSERSDSRGRRHEARAS